ncbi:MAG: mobile mystery protein B [Bdellovibrionaceae bacterium]|nr:mobile mystery protein B [Pseudobdellovibrionaceae bacterium]
MNKFEITYPPGATALDPNELVGLVPNYISTQWDLNHLERENILVAATWALGKSNHDCMNISFCLDLHKRMFSRVWKWAGKTRLTDKNIGVPKEQIFTKLKLLFDDTEFWIQEKTYGFDEIAARFHHRLVAIHTFPNGNGRHARLMTEVIQIVNGETPFTWGSSDLYSSESETRKDYLAALRRADKGDFDALIEFVRK